ncbi:MGH1-like glycoside hydrolase domain-containing protein [Paenibacillus sp.]|uniref:MGH1-like glycoside hydrolase domain-containing protein n=1 Tax=Paenibacillus sp. TaxID=58172 RepID=UPI002D6A0E67|nr:hypothetical protein [Paenibacillus sp.]HZG85884.1 hypothetical protein [Paenibacillus sp.]
MSIAHWDERLAAGKKSLRTRPGSLLLGSTGARLWADYVDPKPGFSGRFDFIHKVNIPLLFTVDNSATDSFEPCRAEWYPSHLFLEYEGSALHFTERKFITWDDCAVSCQTWTNRSGEDLVLRLATFERNFGKRGEAQLYGSFPIEHYSFDIDAVLAASDEALLTEVRLKPGESRQFVVAAALGIRGLDLPDRLAERAARYANRGDTAEQVFAEYRTAYGAWFEKAPVFRSSDPLLDRTWAYRWFLLRHNLADPRYGLLQHPLFYEGRSHKKSKTPFGKGGWEFSKLINLSVPLHITDARWYHEPTVSEGALNNMKEGAVDDGLFVCLTVDQKMHSFANFVCWAAYQLYLVHRNAETMRRLLPSLKKQVWLWKSIHGNERDELMIEYRHTRTGKEYQPSYWYFHNYPKNPKDPETYTHLKRVDRTVYHYLNALGVARLCEELGDPEAAVFRGIAERIKQDVLGKMWDAETSFFYDLHHQTDEKAFVKNIVGFYPAWAQMLDERYDGLIHHLFDEKEFRTKCPFPSVSADCPAYAKEGGWMGHFVKGRNGCVWDGPTWPYTNSIALDALAKESKRRDHRFDRQFAYYLREYSFLHFFHRDLNQPGLVEHYNSETGEPLSDEHEYNHSFYIDLVVSHVAGLSVESDRLVLDPVDAGLDYFCLDRVKAAGLQIRITYRKPGVREDSGIEEGYRLFVDGELVYSSAALSRVELPLRELGRGRD